MLKRTNFVALHSSFSLDHRTPFLYQKIEEQRRHMLCSISKAVASIITFVSSTLMFNGIFFRQICSFSIIIHDEDASCYFVAHSSLPTKSLSLIFSHWPSRSLKIAKCDFLPEIKSKVIRLTTF